MKIKGIGIFVLILALFLNLVGCKSTKEKVAEQTREFVDTKYVEADWINLDNENYDSDKADELVKETKEDKFVRWTAHITKIDNEGRTVCLQEENLPIIKIECDYKIIDENDNYKEGDLITVSGNVVDYNSVFDYNWNLKNGRIEETTKEDEETLNNYLNDLEKRKKEANEDMWGIKIIETPEHILGSTRDEIVQLFSKDYTRNEKYEQNVDSDAIKFENENMIIVVCFDNNGKAEGVSFLSNNFNEMNIETGENAYTAKNYDDLVNLATDNKDIAIEYNKPNTKYPIEIYIGNTH